MRVIWCLFVLVCVLLISDTAPAQDAKGWLGADVQDVTKAEADNLGWDSPHGAKLVVVAMGSPADKAGLKTGDIILSIDRTVIDTSSEAMGRSLPSDLEKRLPYRCSRMAKSAMSA
jgi:S1-C subfamily serine protease